MYPGLTYKSVSPPRPIEDETQQNQLENMDSLPNVNTIETKYP